MLEVQTEAFMLGPAAKSSGWNPLPLQITAFITSEKSSAWKEKDGGENEWKQYLVKNGVTRARGTLSVQMCGRERYLNVFFFFFSCVEGRGTRGRQRGERMEEDKTGEVTHMEATRKKREQDDWWVERIQSEWDILHLSSQYVSSFRSLSLIHSPSSLQCWPLLFFPPLNLCRFYFLQ